MRRFLTKTRHYLEYILFLCITYLLKLISIDKSAAICSFIARVIGPHLRITRTARRNLSYVFKEQQKQDELIDLTWDNFGRFIGEFPHIAQMSTAEYSKRIEIVNIEEFKDKYKNKPVLIFTGHFANWDFLLQGLPLLEKQFSVIYRKANNKYFDSKLIKLREDSGKGVELIAKGQLGARALIRAVKTGRSIAMLVDQKMNDGISVDFFGKSAMTAPAIAKLALQYGYPIIPCQIIRLKGSYFKVIIHPELNFVVTGDNKFDTLNIMSMINKNLEEWIIQNPEQWFWFHNRWGKS